MTGGAGGSHRGRVTDRSGGAHWWGGTGPAGGGMHAARDSGRRHVLLVALVLVVLVGGVVLALTLAGGTDRPPGATPAPGPATPAPGPAAGAAAPTTTTPPAGVVSDPATLQATIDEVVADSPLRFPPNAVEPTTEAAAAVDRLAALLRATPGPAVTVEGHTAPVGEATGGGQQLSEQRAAAVAGRLEAAGVPAGRLRVVGVGPACPLATAEASRRVELHVDN